MNCGESSKSYANVYKPTCVYVCRGDWSSHSNTELAELNVLSAKESSRRMEVMKNVNLISDSYNDNILVCFSFLVLYCIQFDFKLRQMFVFYAT